MFSVDGYERISLQIGHNMPQMFTEGENVIYNGRPAMIIHINPYILRMSDFNCYVPLTDTNHVASTGEVESSFRPIPTGVLQRILDYVDHHASDTPTGAG